MDKTVIELFAGVGGFRVGFNRITSFDQDSGLAIDNGEWDFVWANQWEPSTKVQHAFDAYTTRFGTAGVSNEDINSVNKSEIPDHSLLVGGFPCQDYSVARTLSGNKGLEGIKGVLFWDIIQTIKEKKTPFILLENVDRLLKSPASQRGRDFGIMLRTLHDLDYDVEWRVINAADYGRSQRRRRVFIFAWKNDLIYSQSYANVESIDFLESDSLFAKSFPIKEFKNNKTLGTIDIREMKDTAQMTDEFEFNFQNTGMMIDGIITTFKSDPIKEKSITIRQQLDNSTNKKDFILNKDQIKKFDYLKGGKRIERVKPNGETYFYSEGSMSAVDSLDLPGRTMLTSEKSVNRSTHVIVDPILNKKRFITPIEAERLQDFPDNWTDTGMPLNRRYFMMGNALVTGVVSRIETELSLIIDNEI